MQESQNLPSPDLKAVSSGLKAFNAKKAELEQLVAEAKQLDLTDLTDKDQYKRINEARKKLKSARIPVEKDGKQLRDMVRPMLDYISSKEKELVDIVKPEEIRLSQLEDKYERHQQELKRQEEENRRKKLQDRIAKLKEVEYEHDPLELDVMADDHFNAIYESAKAVYDIEVEKRERLAREEEERKQREREEMERREKQVAEEQERLRQLREEEERKAEALKKEREEFEQKQREFEERQRQEEERIKRENAEILNRKINARRNELFSLGFVVDGPGFSFLSVFIHQVILTEQTEEGWSKVIESAKTEIEELKAIAQKEAEEKAKRDAEEKERREEEERKKAEADRLEKEKAEKEEAARIEAMRPEKEKAETYMRSLGFTDQRPQIENPDINEIVDNLTFEVNRLMKQHIAKLNHL